MSSQFDDLKKRARALSREEKAALARVLIDELDPVNEPGVDELWLEEARRRYDAYRRGEVQSNPRRLGDGPSPQPAAVIGYRFLPLAEEEMTDAALFYESAAPSLGHDFLDDLQYAIDTVRERPELGVLVAHGFRRVLVGRFPYSLIYAVEAGLSCGGCRRPPTETPRVLEGAHLTANNAFERAVGHCGPRLARQRGRRTAAQLGR